MGTIARSLNIFEMPEYLNIFSFIIQINHRNNKNIQN